MLVAVALIASAPSSAAPSAPAPPSAPSTQLLPPAAFTSGPVRADARRLAELLMPEDLYLDAMERAVATALVHAEAGFEHVDPALLKALTSELGKVTRLHQQANMPATYDRYGRALASHFTVDDVTKLAGFYGSRPGQKLIVGKLAGLDISIMLHKWIEDPDADLTDADLKSLNRNAVSKVFEHLDKSDISALLAFARTPVFARLTAFVPTMTALETQIASEPDPELDAKMEAAVNAVMARFPAARGTS
jgi:hypothetical protein